VELPTEEARTSPTVHLAREDFELPDCHLPNKFDIELPADNEAGTSPTVHFAGEDLKPPNCHLPNEFDVKLPTDDEHLKPTN
jgi:hypothetical protein